MGMYVRALAYMMSHGADGLRQVAEDAVLNANYVKARLSGALSAAFPDGPCMHEALFDDAWLEGTGVTTLDFAKALIDEGFHPMTMYFPLVVHGAMLIEPTETEPQARDRPLLRRPAASWPPRPRPATSSASRARRSTPRCAASTRPTPPVAPAALDPAGGLIRRRGMTRTPRLEPGAEVRADSRKKPLSREGLRPI